MQICITRSQRLSPLAFAAPLAAAILTGINHPIRRYVLIMANEPLFFSALMGTVSLGASLDQFRTGRHRRAHRRQLSGLVAHSSANFSARCRIGQLEGHCRYFQRRRWQFRDSFRKMIDRRGRSAAEPQAKKTITTKCLARLLRNQKSEYLAQRPKAAKGELVISTQRRNPSQIPHIRSG